VKRNFDALYSGSSDLKLCNAIANLTKHFEYKKGVKNRVQDPVLSQHQNVVIHAPCALASAGEDVEQLYLNEELGFSEETFSFTITDNQNREYDAIDLADRCFRVWKAFLSTEGLLQ